MQIRTTHFGSVQITAADLFHFPEGLVGLEECQQWILLADQGNPVVGWLQSVSHEDVAVAVISPKRFLPDYRFHLPHEQLEVIQPEQEEQIFVLNVVAKNNGVLTTNLKAPIIINLDRRIGYQVVVSDDHSLKHVLTPQGPALRKSA